ncbi:hypothetical protein QCK_4159 [Clostridioides difficile CD45]|uniref:Uncharacterized protein n=2 Tax=root TaxID=1 RepID=A0A3G1E3F9_9CAUD|nr:hypothetical protein [Clostridioides difficile]YP_009830882.1 hypothetical protein HWA98_gp11 [Clostridium phage CDKM15]ANT45154.1 hypothetical protein CDKM15_11 [Clostridium phage CDKM15]AXU80850.1 hypothetical protein CDIF29688_03557 [Clostridioides difficile]EJA6384773.1 hypothetical protein [Clostridioides difficile]EJA6623818.1 hypothetical protein [Clostridioides difficile]EJA6787278.1 hypothetical protein [Clostridioides difficile]
MKYTLANIRPLNNFLDFNLESFEILTKKMPIDILKPKVELISLDYGEVKLIKKYTDCI